jgi:hypothetical protein
VQILHAIFQPVLERLDRLAIDPVRPTLVQLEPRLFEKRGTQQMREGRKPQPMIRPGLLGHPLQFR